MQDLAQEVFLRFFSKSHRVVSPAALKPYLWAICTRVAQEDLRRRRVRRWLSLTNDGELPEISVAAGDVVARQAVANLYRILDRLTATDRSLFVLRFIEELELTEVAAVQGLSFSTTRRRLDRVWKRVRAQIEKDETLRSYLSPDFSQDTGVPRVAHAPARGGWGT